MERGSGNQSPLVPGERLKRGLTLPAIPVATIDPSSAVTSPSDGETWALDLVGNWDKKAAGALAQGSWPAASTDDYAPPNPLHQYTSVTPAGETSKPFEHDFLGQLRKNGRREHEYTWDFFGRLTKVCEGPEGSCGAVATYRYDALNRRVEKVVEAPHPTWDRVTRFYYDGWRAIEERAVELEGTPEGEVEYVRARYGFGVGLDEVVWMDRDRTSAPTGVLADRYFFAHDLLGSVVAATEDRAASTETLQVVERYTYSAYGEVSVWTAGWSQASGTYVGPAQGHSAIGMPYLYTGQRQDPESGLWYFKNRMYDGESGRFLRRDLIGYGDGPNLYRYARSNPTLFLDPMGLSSCPSGYPGCGDGKLGGPEGDLSGGRGPRWPGGGPGWDPKGPCRGGGPNCYVIGEGITEADRLETEAKLRKECADGKRDADFCSRIDSPTRHIVVGPGGEVLRTMETSDHWPASFKHILSDRVTSFAKDPGPMRAIGGGINAFRGAYLGLFGDWPSTRPVNDGKGPKVDVSCHGEICEPDIQRDAERVKKFLGPGFAGRAPRCRRAIIEKGRDWNNRHGETALTCVLTKFQESTIACTDTEFGGRTIGTMVGGVLPLSGTGGCAGAAGGSDTVIIHELMHECGAPNEPNNRQWGPANEIAEECVDELQLWGGQ